MGKVKNPNNSECYTSSSEPFIIYMCSNVERVVAVNSFEVLAWREATNTFQLLRTARVPGGLASCGRLVECFHTSGPARVKWRPTSSQGIQVCGCECIEYVRKWPRNARRKVGKERENDSEKKVLWSGTSWLGSSVGPRASLDVMAKMEIPAPLGIRISIQLSQFTTELYIWVITLYFSRSCHWTF
jgi:hypothetical protein